MWGVGLWAAIHIVANGDLASLLFFGGFLLTALGGAWHLDRRMAATEGARWQRFTAVTSFVPFAALLAGRQRWAWRELGRPVAWGLGVFVLLLFLHVHLFGVRPTELPRPLARRYRVRDRRASVPGRPRNGHLTARAIAG